MFSPRLFCFSLVRRVYVSHQWVTAVREAPISLSVWNNNTKIKQALVFYLQPVFISLCLSLNLSDSRLTHLRSMLTGKFVNSGHDWKPDYIIAYFMIVGKKRILIDLLHILTVPPSYRQAQEQMFLYHTALWFLICLTVLTALGKSTVTQCCYLSSNMMTMLFHYDSVLLVTIDTK